MINLILKIFRLIFVKDRVLKNDYKFDKIRKMYTVSNGAKGVFMRKGDVLAQYAGRFVLISANDFATIMMGKKSSEDQLLLKYPALDKKDNIEEYIKEYYTISRDFYDIYAKNKNKGTNEIKALNEEFGHHELIRDTPTYVILNTLTIYYRICSCYLTYHRHNNKEFDMKVSESLLNTYFIRTFVINIAFPIVEASYHYLDNLTDVEEKYGKIVREWCEKFLEIDNKLYEKGIEDKETRDHLIKLVQKIFLSFPFISVIVNYTKLDFTEFKHFCENIYLIENDKIKNNIFDIINSPNFKKNTFEKYLIREIENRTTNTQLDKEFLASLLFLATETSDGFVPNSIKRFIFKRLIVCKNKSVFIKILSKRNKKNVDDAYKDFPAVKCISSKNQFLCIDNSMKIFKGKTFIIAQNSFEPTLAGENGYITIVDSPICESLLFQALLIKSVSLLLQYLDKSNNYCTKNEFQKEFRLLLSTMPIQNRNLIKDDILNMFYNEAKDILNDYKEKKEFNIGAIAKRFEESIKKIQEEIRNSNYNEDQIKSFKIFCDLYYVHGY